MIRIHSSRTKITELRSRRHKPYRRLGKTDGLWYGCDLDWIRWMSSEMPDWLSNCLYFYDLEIDLDKIIVLSNSMDIRNFSEEFWLKEKNPYNDVMLQMGGRGSATSLGYNLAHNHHMIDWAKVRKEYMGIEIAPYIYESRMDVGWYYGWDAASGCIWDKRAILSIDETRHKDKIEEYVKMVIGHLIPHDKQGLVYTERTDKPRERDWDDSQPPIDPLGKHDIGIDYIEENTI